MAYTLKEIPPVYNVTTTPAVVVELTLLEQIQEFFQNEQKVALNLIIPSLCAFFLGCIILYVIHRLRILHRRNKRKRRHMARLENEKSPILDDVDEESNLPSRPDSTKKLRGKPKKLQFTYQQPTDKSLSPAKSSTLTTPDLRSVSRITMDRQSSRNSVTVSTRSEISRKTKPMTHIYTKCQCPSGENHMPGCVQGKLRENKSYSPEGAVSSSDVNVAIKDAMAKVDQYEKELQYNPQMKQLLEKYRRMRMVRKQKAITDHLQKGNLQQVPIATILERKKTLKDSGRISTISSQM